MLRTALAELKAAAETVMAADHFMLLVCELRLGYQKNACESLGSTLVLRNFLGKLLRLRDK